MTIYYYLTRNREQQGTSQIELLTQSTRNKHCSSFWLGSFSVVVGTLENPTPHIKGWLGKVSKGYFSLHKDQQTLDWLPKAIMATKENVSISAKGLGNENVQ
ncbi:MAG: hypothetical protein GY718_09530 [Lentisphaerae bacterium]|nr:hypothetical protein [Lentisphaerota bacterium]MCP4087852.1 hypothetical protein [Actinomycetes bacterium]